MDGERYRIKEYHLKNRHFIGKSIYVKNATKPVFGVYDKARLKPISSAIQTS